MRKSYMHAFFLLQLLFLRSVRSEKCVAPSNLDTSNPPDEWCALNSRITLVSPCDLNVEERLRVPYTSKVLHRSIVKQRVMRVESVSAVQMMENNSVALTKPNVSVRTNRLVVDLSINTRRRSKSPTEFIIRYTLRGGAQLFAPCSADGSIFNASRADSSRTAVVSWRPGALMPRAIGALNVAFVVKEALATNAVGVSRAGVATATRGDIVTTVMTFPQTKVGNDGSLAAFYILFGPKGSMGRGMCAAPRHCASERGLDALKARAPGSITARLERALLIAAGTFVALFAIGFAILCCWMKRRKAEQEEANAGIEADLAVHSMASVPLSMHHFVYDTGDKYPPGKRAPQEPRRKAEEVSVRDISTYGARELK